MQGAADAVADQFAHHSVVKILFDILLNSEADIAKPVPGHCLVDGFIERSIGHPAKLHDLFADIAQRKGVSGITEIAVHKDAAIDGDNIAIGEDLLR